MLAMEPRSLWVSFCAHNEHVYIRSPAFTCLLSQRNRPGTGWLPKWDVKGNPCFLSLLSVPDSVLPLFLLLNPYLCPWCGGLFSWWSLQSREEVSDLAM